MTLLIDYITGTPSIGIDSERLDAQLAALGLPHAPFDLPQGWSMNCDSCHRQLTRAFPERHQAARAWLIAGQPTCPDC